MRRRSAGQSASALALFLLSTPLLAQKSGDQIPRLPPVAVDVVVH
jgi:hypothetical protein